MPELAWIALGYFIVGIFVGIGTAYHFGRYLMREYYGRFNRQLAKKLEDMNREDEADTFLCAADLYDKLRWEPGWKSDE
jgi:hypothetical protein